MTLEADVAVQLEAFTLSVSFAANDGETIAVVGPNGAGKTTLLRTLAGLVPLTAGRITLAGRVLDDATTGAFVAPERRSVAVVFQDGLLFPHLHAVDNVAFGLRARGVARAEANRFATAWLRRVGLEGRERAWPRELSGGQQQRVALARALATEPALLLLDEPLAALDASTRNDVRRDLVDYLALLDGVRVVVTHDPVDAAALADRVVVLEAGRVTQTGTPTAIATAPPHGVGRRAGRHEPLHRPGRSRHHRARPRGFPRRRRHHGGRSSVRSSAASCGGAAPRPSGWLASQRVAGSGG